jgi:hypothetical protein
MRLDSTLLHLVLLVIIASTHSGQKYTELAHNVSLKEFLYPWAAYLGQKVTPKVGFHGFNLTFLVKSQKMQCWEVCGFPSSNQTLFSRKLEGLVGVSDIEPSTLFGKLTDVLLG